MTTSEDEIRHLRDALEHLRQWSAHEMKYDTNATARTVFEAVHGAVMRALKTPRASKGLPVVRSPIYIE